MWFYWSSASGYNQITRFVKSDIGGVWKHGGDFAAQSAACSLPMTALWQFGSSLPGISQTSSGVWAITPANSEGKKMVNKLFSFRLNIIILLIIVFRTFLQGAASAGTAAWTTTWDYLPNSFRTTTAYGRRRLWISWPVVSIIVASAVIITLLMASALCLELALELLLEFVFTLPSLRTP